MRTKQFYVAGINYIRIKGENWLSIRSLFVCSLFSVKCCFVLSFLCSLKGCSVTVDLFYVSPKMPFGGDMSLTYLRNIYEWELGV